jgi:hypothetical protein
MSRPEAPVPTEMQRMTYRAFLDHVERCEACNDRRPCVTGEWLQRTQRTAACEL